MSSSCTNSSSILHTSSRRSNPQYFKDTHTHILHFAMELMATKYSKGKLHFNLANLRELILESLSERFLKLKKW